MATNETNPQKGPPMNARKSKKIRKQAHKNTVGQPYRKYQYKSNGQHKNSSIQLTKTCTRSEIKRLKKQSS